MHIEKKYKPVKSVFTSHPGSQPGSPVPRASTALGSCGSFLETFHACTSMYVYIIYTCISM